jgi:hypothetical protein
MRTLPFNRELRTDPRQLLHNHRGRRGPQRKNRSARSPASHFKLDTCRPPAGTPFSPFSPAAPPHLWLVTCHVSLITYVLVTYHLSLQALRLRRPEPGARRQAFRRGPLLFRIMSPEEPDGTQRMRDIKNSASLVFPSPVPFWLPFSLPHVWRASIMMLSRLSVTDLEAPWTRTLFMSVCYCVLGSTQKERFQTLA